MFIHKKSCSWPTPPSPPHPSKKWINQLKIVCLKAYANNAMLVLQLFWLLLGLQRYTGVPVRRNIFCHDTNIVYWTSYHDIYDTSTYASTNMGKHCLQFMLTLLPLFSPYAWRFSGQIDEKNPCWAVFSIDWACQLYRLLSPQASTKQYPSCFVVM